MGILVVSITSFSSREPFPALLQGLGHHQTLIFSFLKRLVTSPLWLYRVLIVHAVCICHIHSACNVDIMELNGRLIIEKTPARSVVVGLVVFWVLFLLLWDFKTSSVCVYAVLVYEAGSKNCVVDTGK